MYLELERGDGSKWDLYLYICFFGRIVFLFFFKCVAMILCICRCVVVSTGRELATARWLDGKDQSARCSNLSIQVRQQPPAGSAITSLLGPSSKHPISAWHLICSGIYDCAGLAELHRGVSGLFMGARWMTRHVRS